MPWAFVAIFIAAIGIVIFGRVSISYCASTGELSSATSRTLAFIPTLASSATLAAASASVAYRCTPHFQRPEYFTCNMYMAHFLSCLPASFNEAFAQNGSFLLPLLQVLARITLFASFHLALFYCNYTLTHHSACVNRFFQKFQKFLIFFEICLLYQRSTIRNKTNLL